MHKLLAVSEPNFVHIISGTYTDSISAKKNWLIFWLSIRAVVLEILYVKLRECEENVAPKLKKFEIM